METAILLAAQTYSELSGMDVKEILVEAMEEGPVRNSLMMLVLAVKD